MGAGTTFAISTCDGAGANPDGFLNEVMSGVVTQMVARRKFKGLLFAIRQTRFVVQNGQSSRQGSTVMKLGAVPKW
jgi:hypothetical protein